MSTNRSIEDRVRDLERHVDQADDNTSRIALRTAKAAAWAAVISAFAAYSQLIMDAFSWIRDASMDK